jgi:vacuolar-type H+-ATPase subunit I/STV1
MNTQEHYKEKVSAQLDELEAEIDKLKASSSKDKVELKIKFDSYIDELDAKRKDVGEKLASIKDSGDKAMDDVQRGLKEAWDRLEIAQRAAKARFN